jgi:hypothetical protein
LTFRIRENKKADYIPHPVFLPVTKPLVDLRNLHSFGVDFGSDVLLSRLEVSGPREWHHGRHCRLRIEGLNDFVLEEETTL